MCVKGRERVCVYVRGGERGYVCKRESERGGVCVFVSSLHLCCCFLEDIFSSLKHSVCCAVMLLSVPECSTG